MVGVVVVVGGALRSVEGGGCGWMGWLLCAV